jgi:Chitinase class I/Carbohydrate binding module (family 6)
MASARSMVVRFALTLASFSILGCGAQGIEEPQQEVDEQSDGLTTSTYQAENATVYGAVKTSNQSGYSGSGFVDYQHASGDYVDWTVSIPSTGDYNLIVRYANGGSTNRPLKLTVDGTTVNASMAFNPTGSWTTWKTSTQKAKLSSGTRHVRLTAIGYSGGNIDYLQTSGPLTSGTSGIAGVVSESMFNSMFPNRNTFYTYAGLTSINNVYSAFCNSTDTTIRKREAAAFLANISWESDWLKAIKEYDTSNYCDYCGSCGCPAGKCNYYGRGPIQLSWDCNYLAAGNSIGQDLLHKPDLVSSNASIAWQTAGWYWNTQGGPGGYGSSAHAAMLASSGSGGFGATIAHINGAQECPSLGGTNTSARDQRISRYKHFCDLLGVSYGNNLSC